MFLLFIFWRHADRFSVFLFFFFSFSCWLYKNYANPSKIPALVCFLYRNRHAEAIFDGVGVDKGQDNHGVSDTDRQRLFFIYEIISRWKLLFGVLHRTPNSTPSILSAPNRLIPTCVVEENPRHDVLLIVLTPRVVLLLLLLGWTLVVILSVIFKSFCQDIKGGTWKINGLLCNEEVSKG